MSFYTLLEQEYIPLHEQQAMTLKQRQKVASMRRSGWDIKDRDENKVIMTKGDKEVFVYPTGKTFFLTESEEVDITEMTDSLLQEDDLLVEGVADDITNKIKRIAENATMTTLRRGSTAFVVTMGKSNEYTRIENGKPVDSGTLANRRTAEDLVFRLEQSGFREEKFTSVVPRSITRSTKFILRQSPFIALMFILYSMLPAPIAAIINAIARGAWWVISGIIMAALPFESLQTLSGQIDDILSFSPSPVEIPNIEGVDGLSGG